MHFFSNVSTISHKLIKYTTNKSHAVLQHTLQTQRNPHIKNTFTLDRSSVGMMEATTLQMWWSSSNGGRNAFKWRPQLFCIVQSMPTLLQLYLHVGNGVNLQLYVLHQQYPVIILQRTRRIKRTRRINLVHHQKNDLLCITFSLQATIY